MCKIINKYKLYNNNDENDLITNVLTNWNMLERVFLDRGVGSDVCLTYFYLYINDDYSVFNAKRLQVLFIQNPVLVNNISYTNEGDNDDNIGNIWSQWEYMIFLDIYAAFVTTPNEGLMFASVFLCLFCSFFCSN